MERIYSAGWQGRKVRFVAWVVVGALALALWGGWKIAHGYGLSPGDGGVLKPLPVRLAWGGSVAALGLLFAAGMWIYGRCYVADASIDETRGVLDITLIGLLLRSRMEVPVGDVEGSTYHAGRSHTGDFTIDAPWVSVRLRGRRLPLIIDGQGEFIRRERVVEHLFRAPRGGKRAKARSR